MYPYSSQQRNYMHRMFKLYQNQESWHMKLQQQINEYTTDFESDDYKGLIFVCQILEAEMDLMLELKREYQLSILDEA